MDCANNAWRYWTIACLDATSPQQMPPLLLAFLQYRTLKVGFVAHKGSWLRARKIPAQSNNKVKTFVEGIIIPLFKQMELSSRAFCGLKSAVIVNGIWKLYLRGVTCCQTQLLCVGYSSWLLATAWALTSPPTSAWAAVYTNPSAAFYSASHAALRIGCQVGYVAERANYRTAFQQVGGLWQS